MNLFSGIVALHFTLPFALHLSRCLNSAHWAEGLTAEI